MRAMRRLAIVAIVIAVISLAVSGYALWRTFDEEDQPTGLAALAAATEESNSTSTTSDVVVVPSQAGKTPWNAAAGLKLAGLEHKFSRKPSVTVPVDRVVSQVPVEGTSVPRGTVIELFLSSGPP
jgi:beta-lactam-binding protein with PASTA domain